MFPTVRKYQKSLISQASEYICTSLFRIVQRCKKCVEFQETDRLCRKKRKNVFGHCQVENFLYLAKFS